MEVTNPFEGAILIFLIIAIRYSTMPKRIAIAVILFVAIADRFAEAYGLYWAESLVYMLPWLELGDPKWIPANLVVMSQAVGCISLAIIGSRLIDKHDRRFFWIMSVFLLAAGSLIPIFQATSMNFEAYTFLYRAVAISQVLTVYYYSNGTKQFIRAIGNSIVASRGRTAH